MNERLSSESHKLVLVLQAFGPASRLASACSESDDLHHYEQVFWLDSFQGCQPSQS